jgi:hypothetical protein
MCFFDCRWSAGFVPPHPSIRVNSRQTAEWAQRSGGWFGRVVYAVDDGGRVVLVEAWVPAEHLEPAAR